MTSIDARPSDALLSPGQVWVWRGDHTPPQWVVSARGALVLDGEGGA